MSINLYSSSKYWFTIVQGDDGRLFIDAVCGTSGLDEVREELTDEEVQLFHVDPESLAPVARRICKEWSMRAAREHKT